MGPLFIAGLLVKLCKTWEADIITVEVRKEVVVSVGYVVLDIDLLVKSSLASRGIALSSEGFGAGWGDFNKLVLDFDEGLKDDAGEGFGGVFGSGGGDEEGE